MTMRGLVATWGYEASQWIGGCATDRLAIAVANDIIAMDEAGSIWSVTAGQAYGDYKQTMLTRSPGPDGTPFMDEYIRDNVKLSAIDDFHMTFDPVLRCIYIFVVRTGQTKVDTSLVYYIDRGPKEGWIIHRNRDSESGYKASCSTLVRKAVGDYKVYTGGWENGFVWELQTTTQDDDGAAYDSMSEGPNAHFGDPAIKKEIRIP